MVTAVDTNVSIDVLLNDPQYRSASFAALTKAFSSGDVIVGEVVWSETGAAFPDEQSFLASMDKLGVRFVPMSKEAATKASNMWRLAKVNRTPPPRRVIADFLVGAHAESCADCLLTRDNGFYRSYFSNLKELGLLEIDWAFMPGEKGRVSVDGFIQDICFEIYNGGKYKVW